MKNGCCGRQNSDAMVAGRSWTSVVRRAMSWVVPGVVLAAMPKCPLCLAAYVALFSGFGISLTAAQFAWWSVGIACVIMLVYAAVTTVRRFFRLG
jgi:hypothetical protein